MNLKKERKPTHRIVGDGIACGQCGKDSTRAVCEKRCTGRGEEILVHISHASKQFAMLPFFSVPQQCDGRQTIFFFYVRKRLIIIDDVSMRSHYMNSRKAEG